MRYIKAFESKENEYLDLLKDLFTSISDDYTVDIIEEAENIFSIKVRFPIPSFPCSTGDFNKFMESSLSISKKIDEVNNRLSGYNVKCSITSLPMGQGKQEMFFYLDMNLKKKKVRYLGLRKMKVLLLL